VDDVTWAALTLTLTLLGGIWTWLAFRRKGVASGMRAAAFTLLPAAAWLTHTLQMLTRIAEAVVDWATTLVFSPAVWAGVVLAGISGVLFVVSGYLRSRQLARAPEQAKQVGRSGRRGRSGALSKGPKPHDGPVVDDDPDGMAEIEALLKRRGIS
jgi:hypothetical protein